MKTDFRHRIEYKEYMETTQFSARITVLGVFWAAIMCTYLFMFYYLQIVRGSHFSDLAEANRIRRVNVPAPRGPILDRNGLVIARNRPAFEVLLTREKVRDLEGMMRTLAPVIGVPQEDLREKLARALTTPAYEPIVIGSDVSLAAASFIESRRADLPGISIRMSMKRHYPEGELGAHFLGHVGEITRRMLEQAKPGDDLRQGDIVGRSGLERTYGADLQGRRGERQVVVNSGGRVMEELVGGIAPVPGAALTLTIDLDLQRELETAFGDRVGAAVFMDPRTGAILAMTSRPGYDPNFFARRFSRTVWKGLMDDPLDPLQNRAVQSAYSPGSTFKPLMAAAALEEGIAGEGTVFHCGGSGLFHGRVFRCHERGGHGTIGMKEAIKKSCNIYFYNLGSRLGIEAISRYAKHMGLGKVTGIDIEPESAGLVGDAAWKQSVSGERWYPSETISVSIGQGPLSITPLQMAMVQGYIATNGLRVRPHLRAGGGGAVGGDESYEVISRRSLHVVREAEWAVVNDHGTGWRAQIEGKDVCGKTGTAQVYAGSADLEDDQIPEAMRDHAWFVGFAPRDDAQIAFAIIVEHGGHGGDAAAPIAQKVLERFFGVRKPPEEKLPEGQVAHARQAPQSEL